MWRTTLTGSTLTVTPGRAEIDPPESLRSIPARKPRRRAPKSEAADPSERAERLAARARPPAAPASAAKKKGGAGGIAGLSPDLWTERKVVEHLNSSKPNPELLRVDEMHARIDASHKFLCAFANAHGSICTVWIPDGVLYRSYPEAYQKAKARFVQEVAR